MQIETHPLPAFVLPSTRLLLLGSFPPPRSRWAMDFYYPNFQNDMWRIMGLVFFADKAYFVCQKTFNQSAIQDFLTHYHIGIADMAYQVCRLAGNASDKFLQVITPLDIKNLLKQLPNCEHIAVTGDKALQVLLSQLQVSTKLKTNESIQITINIHYTDKKITIYRLPSSSRAYPLSLDKKAKSYHAVFKQAGILDKQ